MRGVWMVALSLALAGCGSEDAARSDEEPVVEGASPGENAPASEATTASAVPAEATPAPAAVDPAREALVARANAIPFRWFDVAPEGGVPSTFGAIGAARRFEVVSDGHTRTYEVTDAGALIARSDGEQLWQVQLGDVPSAMPTIAGWVDPDTHEETILVAAPIGTSWMVEQRSASDGAQRWHSVGGVRCVGVQIGVEGDLVALHVRENAQDRTYVLRAADGAPVTEIPVHPAASRLRRGEADAAATPAQRAVAAPTRVTCTGAQPAECTLRREGVEGELRWTSSIPASCRELAVAGEGEHVFVAEICANATGVSVHGGSLSDATTQFHTQPFGVGPIAHSRWSNAITLSVDDRFVRVWGTESSLTYVTVIDRASGREISTVTGR